MTVTSGKNRSRFSMGGDTLMAGFPKLNFEESTKQSTFAAYHDGFERRRLLNN
jgi:hypothetical protein